MSAAALLMTALWLILCRPLRGREIALILLLVGLAFVSTIKAVLYAPAFLGVLLFRLEKPRHRRALASAAIMVALAGLALLWLAPHLPTTGPVGRSEEHTSELQSLMRISYAVFFWKKKIHTTPITYCT